MCLLEPIPGEEFKVSLDDNNLMMTAKFKSWEIDLESKENKDMIRHHQKLDIDQADYKTLNISELGGVFNSVGNKAMKVKNLHGNLISLIGDPGVGKTTAVQRLVWDWVKEKDHISKRYKIVFFIQVRHVRKDSLIDVLSELNLLPDPSTDGIQNLHDFSKDTLFILDGADENDISGDLHHLITGDLYPDSTVLLTARPEAKCFKCFPVLPRVKVTLLGTDDETVHRYMREAVSPSSGEEFKSFQDNYQQKLLDTSLLNIPLYLSILCAMFKAHIARGLKCTNLKIPVSSTELFNAFLHVVIRRWLARTNRNQTVSFEKSPLDPNSSVPAEIKTTLYFIGKLCYKDLTQSISDYQFTDTQAGEFLLDMQVIKDCGLFNVGKYGKHEFFYLRHKQLQEYMAALYLSHKGTKEHSFHELLHSKKNKGQSLFDVMRDLTAVQLVQFACGLSGAFLKSLLNTAISQFSVSVNFLGFRLQNIPDIYYAAVLFTEQHSGDLSSVKADDLHGFTELKKYLLYTQIRQIRKHFIERLFLFDEKCLHKLCGIIDKAMTLQLLSRFYGIHLKPVAGEEIMNYEIEGHSGSEIDLCLDQLQTELLNVVCISRVQSVVSHTKHVFIDIPGLLETFPHLSKLRIIGNIYTPYCCNLRLGREMCTSLTSVTLHGDISSCTLPESHVHSLLQQSQLSCLKLYGVNILPVLACTSKPLWSHLQDLSLVDLYKSDDDGRGMCRLLQSVRGSLTQCYLDINIVGNVLPLIEKGLKSLKSLQDLSLVLNVTDQPYHLCDTLQRVLPHLNTLHALSVDYSCVCDMLETFVETVCEFKNIRTLTIYSIDEPVLPQQWQEILTQHGVKVIIY